MALRVLREWIPSNFRFILTLLDLPMTLASLKLKECPVEGKKHSFNIAF